MVCDKNCKLCVFDDCICESEDYSDIDTEDVDLEASKQRAIEKGYYKQWKYYHFGNGKTTQKHYRQSEKGKAMARRRTQKKIESGKNAEACRRYYERKKREVKSMKLHVYVLKENYLSSDCEIAYKDYEAEEKPKTYKVIENAAFNIVRKTDIGRITENLYKTIVLTERNDDLAVKLFSKNRSEMIERMENDLAREQERLKQITGNGVVEL